MLVFCLELPHVLVWCSSVVHTHLLQNLLQVALQEHETLNSTGQCIEDMHKGHGYDPCIFANLAACFQAGCFESLKCMLPGWCVYGERERYKCTHWRLGSFMDQILEVVELMCLKRREDEV